MKTASTLLCAAAFILASASCDKHSFEETKVLHEGMHKHEAHGDAHAKETEHGEKAHAPDAHAPAAEPAKH